MVSFCQRGPPSPWCLTELDFPLLLPCLLLSMAVKFTAFPCLFFIHLLVNHILLLLPECCPVGIQATRVSGQGYHGLRVEQGPLRSGGRRPAGPKAWVPGLDCPAPGMRLWGSAFFG
jgi:hypothetical protein